MRYETIARLGRGGMGVVDLARDADGNRVALKRLTLHGSASDIVRARTRLLREAQVLRRLRHPNVVRLLDVLEEGDEVVLVMPYLPSGNLAERVAQHGPAPPDEVERQARRLFAALAAAHAAGVVHRDIKPANILFDDQGEPCLADFGVAHSWDHTQGLTVSGMVVGTPGFMAPEQARGEPVTPASDVFSLGATLLFAATGEGPFGPGDPALLMVRAANGKVDKVPRQLPASLRQLLRSTLQARPERRPSAAAVVEQAHRFPGGLSNLRPPGRGRTWAVAGLAAALVGGVALAGVSRDGGGDAIGGAAATSCVDKPYRSCAEPANAPNTDGERCLEGFADADGDRRNGCEAPAGDLEDGAPLVDERVATINPPGDIDTYRIAPADPVSGGPLPCDRSLLLRLEAPEGMALRLRVRSDANVLGEVEASPGSPAVLQLGPERCERSPSGQLEAVVSAVGGDHSPLPYVLQVETAP